MRLRGWSCALGLALAAVVSASAANEIYRRATPVETRAGLVSIRAVHGALLDVPVDCDEGRSKCRETTRFPTVCAVSFALESRESRGENPRIDVADRGTVYLALRFDPADEELFFDELRQVLHHLSADAFPEIFAGLDNGSVPFDSIRERSVDPSWTCFENDSSRRLTRHSRKTRRLPDGTVGIQSVNTYSYSQDEISLPLCEAMASLVEDTFPEELRTISLPRVMLETAVVLQVEDQLESDAYPEDLTPLPLGASFTVKRVEQKEPSRRTSGATDGSFMAVTHTKESAERKAVAVPADLMPGAATRNAWLSRWTVETSDRRLGPMPTVTLQNTHTLLVALLPTLPPVPVDGDGQPQSAPPRESYAVEFDDDAFLDEIARRLDAAADLNEATLVEAVTHQPVGLRSEGWILVVCHEDGTARYDLAPLGAWNRLTNPSLFCGAVESFLGASTRE